MCIIQTMKQKEDMKMFDMVPFTARYTTPKMWDPFKEFFSTVSRSAATDIKETDSAFQIETELLKEDLLVEFETKSGL